jgi:hypothetical protein
MLELKGDKRTFDRMVAKAQALATGRVSKALMPRIAGGEVKRLAAQAKSSQTAPTGKGWPKTKDGRALQWPSQASIKVTVSNGKIVIKVTGPKYLAAQHSGWRRFRAARRHEMARDAAKVAKTGKGKIATVKRWGGKPRRIIPKGSVPKGWATVITKALNGGWRSFMGSTSLARAKT